MAEDRSDSRKDLEIFKTYLIGSRKPLKTLDIISYDYLQVILEVLKKETPFCLSKLETVTLDLPDEYFEEDLQTFQVTYCYINIRYTSYY
jgi:hypothetical protein